MPFIIIYVDKLYMLCTWHIYLQRASVAHDTTVWCTQRIGRPQTSDGSTRLPGKILYHSVSRTDFIFLKFNNVTHVMLHHSQYIMMGKCSCYILERGLFLKLVYSWSTLFILFLFFHFDIIKTLIRTLHDPLLFGVSSPLFNSIQFNYMYSISHIH